MDMALAFPEQRLFFSTGRRSADGLDAIDGLGLLPAQLARYRDLTRLRYDFPIVLVDDAPAGDAVRSLSSVVDALLVEHAPRGLEGERLRRYVLRLEQEIRTLVAGGTQGRLGELWIAAAANIATTDDAAARDVLVHLGTKLPLDGELVDCNAAMPVRVCEHLWRAAQQRKAAAFRATAERLMVRLSDILRGAYLHSAAGQSPDALKASLGGAHRDAFDFAALSKLVSRTAIRDELPAARRARIERALALLRSQRFFAGTCFPADGGGPYEFRFAECDAAARAFRSRLPALAEVVKALSIAELECDGRYVEAQHDPFFDDFGVGALSADDLALFPDYLVCIAPGCTDSPANACLMDLLSAGLPIKVLVETDDLLQEAAVGTGHFAFGVRSTRLANTATGLGGVFAVQATSSALYASRARLERAFSHRGAALLSVYAATPIASGRLSPYLGAAAALESRAFPAFTYDPYAGDNQAARFALDDNPQAEADWPVTRLEYADDDQQCVREQAAFTLADFMLCDARYAAHFARVPRERWTAALVPADEWLAADAQRQSRTLPCIVAVDDADVLQRLIVDGQLMGMAARCRTFWHRLQEQGGIHNSHAEILLARERARWTEAAASSGDAAMADKAKTSTVEPTAPAGARSAAPAAVAEAGAPDAAARDPDEAWIETARCPSCNECQTINDRMFKYNADKQAYIADIDAGTYRQLVEAAEACQVAIIHPGKPRNPAEPGLVELIERARPFM